MPFSLHGLLLKLKCSCNLGGKCYRPKCAMSETKPASNIALPINRKASFAVFAITPLYAGFWLLVSAATDRLSFEKWEIYEWTVPMTVITCSICFGIGVRQGSYHVAAIVFVSFLICASSLGIALLVSEGTRPLRSPILRNGFIISMVFNWLYYIGVLLLLVRARTITNRAAHTVK